MKPLIRSAIIAASPLACAVALASPEASFLQINPTHGSSVGSPQTVLRGKITHDVYPASVIGATLDGASLRLDANGNFSTTLRLTPGNNEFVLRAATPNPRQQTTQVSAYIDASMVYGSDPIRANALRSFQGGRLLTSEGDLPPLNTAGLENDNAAHIVADQELFLAGDVRANENLELTAIHTLFIREHNQLADAIARANPGLDDEGIFQRARKIVAAEIQVITYREFLPALLGPQAIRPYRAYNPNTNAGIATEFSSAAFRIGHTLINDDIEFFDNDGEEIREGLPLAFAFFNPGPLKETGPDPLLKYLASDPAQEVDNQLVDGLRDFLFGPPGAGGLDLASLNIQRGRDHGLPDYNTVRKAYGLPAVTRIERITSDPTLQSSLLSLYGGIDSIDIWVAGLAEDHLPGSSVGPTFQRIIARQFERTRDGDANWHERSFSGRQLAALSATRLSDIIRRNTTITKLQDNVFFFDDSTLAGLTEKEGSLPPDLIQGQNSLGLPPSLDGSGNNALHPEWGMVGASLLRIAPAAYADGVSSPSGPERPGARLISNEVAVLTTNESNDRNMSAWIYAWGQFIDHDLGLTTNGGEPFDIPVPAGDSSFDPFNTGTETIPFSRSAYDPETGTVAPSVARKIQRITLRPRDRRR